MYRIKLFLFSLSLGIFIIGGLLVSNSFATDNMLIASTSIKTIVSPGKAKVGICKKAENSDCFGCHKKEGWLEKKYVHGPLGMNMCSPCHQTKEDHLSRKFKQKPKELCYYCHEEARIQKDHLSKLKTKTSKCLYCHNPHASEKEYFLR